MPVDGSTPKKIVSTCAIEVLIFNCTKDKLKCWWIDREGKRQDRGLVEVGEFMFYYTYPGDPFLMADDQTGQGKALFIPTQKDVPLAKCFVV